MNLSETPIAGVYVAVSSAHIDHRGVFSRLFCDEELAEVLGQRRIVQVNQSTTMAIGAIRGMHFQYAPHAEMKFVRCIRGRVWDVAVDLRTGSPTMLQWHGEELTPDNRRMLVVPEGCAHGFQAIEPGSELLYLHTARYTPGAQGGVRHDDPLLGIRWPLPVTDLSERDLNHPLLEAGYSGLET